MIKIGICIIIMILISSCSSLSISPRGCKSTGIVASDNLNLKNKVEQNYVVFFGEREVQLKDLVNCQKITAMKVEIDNNLFFQYKIRLSFTDEDMSTVGQ